MTHPASHHPDSPNPAEPLRVHVVPLRLLVGIFLILIVLTVLTYAATYIDLGAGNLWLAMAIAAVKATLVALFFMHLKYDKIFHGVIFMSAIFFVFLFIGILMLDSQAYDPDKIPDYAPEIVQ